MTSPDSASSSRPRPANFTRTTHDLAGKLRRERQWHLLALYHLLRWSDFGREGIERSGSYRFADHLYRNVASGRGWLGRWLDRRLLDLPSARAMRQRYLKAKEAIADALENRNGPLHLLAIPCGIPRDVSELAVEWPDAAQRIRYAGMDLDPEVLAAARAHLAATLVGSQEFIEGNALVAGDFPRRPIDFVVSTGLGEFLDDEQLAIFYGNVFATLEEGGTFFTSATAFERRSDYLMKAFEMEAHYRDKQRTEAILRRHPWRELNFASDATGLQTFVLARK